MAEARSNCNPLIFNKELRERIKQSKVLVVGAGGIGCELLKNLVLTGFQDIEIIDLDTIDVSNLNRQFLFHKKHVGMSKAQVARDSVLQFNPNAKVVAHHASVMSPDFGVSYISNFNLVMNALDNRAARNHVNRLCLASGVPLVESGTAGYSGQVELISKKLTSCYECTPKPTPKSFPGCTIRNTPSELIHCIVWGKHLFNQLFGEHDPSDEDTDVSPDQTDPEAGGGDAAMKRIPMREWAKETGYEGSKLFTKLFLEDINVLLSMKKLWENRRPPSPLTLEAAKGFVAVAQEEDNSTPRMKEQKLWSIAECTDVFMNSINQLKKALEESAHGYLVWDKDDKSAMEFVAATANIRAFIFGIKQDSLFQIKSMAGNIIPAIATSNAVIAGLIVLNAANVLRGQIQQCQSVYLREQPGVRGFLISREVDLVPPNPNCTSCSEKPMVTIATDLSKMKLKEFDALVLKDKLNMIEPEVILTRTGNIILSSEEGEAEDLKDRTLQDLGVTNGSLLEADDFLQNFKIMIVAEQREIGRNDPPFYVLQKSGDFNPKAETTENGGTDGVKAGPSKEAEDDDDDCLMVLDGVEQPRKRKPENNTPVPVKKRKTDDKQMEEDEDNIIVL